jgi:hypothetical protein
MANKRVFVAFAAEDEKLKILFTGQAKNAKVPYEFIDMSIKEPFDEKWKTNCRARIRSCDGVIVLITKNLKKADGAIWEIKCAKEEKIKLIGVYLDGTTLSDTPAELDGVKKVQWTWDNIKEFIESL